MRSIKVLMCFAFIAYLRLSAQEDSCDIPLVVTRFVPPTGKVDLVTDLAPQDLNVRVEDRPSVVKSASIDSGGKRVALILDASKNIPNDEWSLETEMAAALIKNGRTIDRFSLYLVGVDDSFGPFRLIAEVQARLREAASSRPEAVEENERIYDSLFAASELLDPPEFGDTIFLFGHPDDFGSQTTLGKIQLIILRDRLRFYAMSFGELPPLPDPNKPLPKGANPAGLENTARATGYSFSYHYVENLKFRGQTALLKGFLADLYAGITSPYRVRVVQTAPGRSSLDLTVAGGESRNIRQENVHYPHFVYPCTGPSRQDAIEEEELPTRPVARRTRISSGILDRIVAHRVLPQPPWSSEKGHEQGTVTVAVLLDYDGSLKSLSVVSGDPVLAEVATKSIKQWHFKPFLLNGQPFQVESRVVLRFSKKRAEVVLGEH